MPHNPQDTFDPKARMMKIGRAGADYLGVKWRVLWLRTEAPDSVITTEVVQLTDQFALFHCTVTRIINGEVKGVAHGHGSEVPADFGDYIEKAETKAIGRALSILGYGTENAFEEEDANRPCDAPVKNDRATDSRGAGMTHPDSPRKEPMITSGQIISLEHLRKKVAPVHHAWLADNYPNFRGLTQTAAENMIDRLKATLEENVRA